MFKKFLLVFCLTLHSPCFFSYAERPEFSNSHDDLGIISLFLSDHPIILEAGSHYGEDTLRMKNKWPNSTIHAFEPYPVAFSYLQINTQYLTDVFLYPAALYSTSGKYTFYIVAANDGASSLLAPQEYTKVAYQGPIITVDALNLDEWAGQYGVDYIDFMWLDMEGAELQMLSAAPQILKTVKVIFIETNFWHCTDKDQPLLGKGRVVFK